MKALIRWAIVNTPAMNTLIVSAMLVGAVALYFMRREVFPEFDLEYILVQVPYPGASPDEVEEGICQKIEEAVQSISGIKKLSSVAAEGIGTVVLELQSGVRDVQKVLNEVRSEVDRIPSFPVLAEDPEITQITLRTSAIRVAVLGPETEDPDAELQLREIAERVRDELLLLPSVSQANILGARPFQIDVEISEHTLRQYGLTLQEAARILRAENLEVPGGRIKTSSEEVLVRGKGKFSTGAEIARLPLITRPDGTFLAVGDVAVVRDEFDDTDAINRINGRPAMIVSVDKTATEDLLAVVREVRAYVEFHQRHALPSDPGDAARLRGKLEKLTGQVATPLPPGYELVAFADRSDMVRDRLEMLGKNGLQGLVLVFVVLSLFLERRLAFWVAIGIPIAMLGACAVLLAMGETLNMLSMFAFLMALGILVDDAIVVGENVYAHRQRGRGFVQAAIEGTYEVLPSVVASVTTTMVAFLPLLFVPGVMGKFIAVIPLAVIVMLAISLLESAFVLPCHLAHSGQRESRIWHYRPGAGMTLFWSAATLTALGLTLYGFLAADWYSRPLGLLLAAAAFLLFLAPHLLYPIGALGKALDRANAVIDGLLGRFIRRVYTPWLRWAIERPAVVISAGVSFLLLSLGLVLADVVPYVAFPKLDSPNIHATVTYPDGTPAAVSEEAARRLLEAIERVNDEYAAQHGGKPLVLLTHLAVGDVNVTGDIRPGMEPGGGNVGKLAVELVEPSERHIDSTEILRRWRRAARDLGWFPGAEKVVFDAMAAGPGGIPIEFKLLARPENMRQLEEAVERAKQRLHGYRGLFDISDDSRPGKWEFQVKVKDSARAMGVTSRDVYDTIRAAYYGEEVMRLQRGRHEVKLMVRYPRDERRSLANFGEIRVRTGGGAERPITELADVVVQRGYATINRVDQLRSITITADVDEAAGNAAQVIADLKRNFLPQLLAEFPAVQVRWEGQAEQTSESIAGLMVGLMVALAAMFALLTLEFRSYGQPLLIMFAIPFGAVGAVLGHLVMGLPLTLFSLFGLVALTGVVVNDSIVLIDFINHRVREGIPIKQALIDSGQRRVRPVLLTSLTTIAGLTPILIETSFQAQVLIPMATSIVFGLMCSTVMILLLVPSFYLAYHNLFGTRMADDEEAPPGAPGGPAEALAAREGPIVLEYNGRRIEVLSP